METFSYDPIISIYIQFKSYYVVWKPRRGQEQTEKVMKFKSYYVVWKQK